MTDAGLKSLGWLVFWGLFLNGCMNNEATRVYVDGVVQEVAK